MWLFLTKTQPWTLYLGRHLGTEMSLVLALPVRAIPPQFYLLTQIEAKPSRVQG